MSTVIKAGCDYTLVKRPTTIDLADHLAEARQVVAAGRSQAKSIIAQGKHAAAVALKAAQEKGYADGHRQGLDEGIAAGRAQALAEASVRFDQEQATLCGMFETVVREINDAKRDLLIEARHDALEFVVALAQRVVKRVGELDRSAATANLEEALRLVVGKTDLTVRSNPLDLESMERFAAERAARVQGYEHVRVVADASVAPGGCVVVSGGTEIDAGIDTQMNEIVRLLLGDTER